MPPTLDTYTTEQLLDMLPSASGAGLNAIYNELKFRLIAADDNDDNEGAHSGEYKTRGGIRPYHAPTII